ncbi:acyl-CoA dehydrogenase [Parasphingorhabdus sp. JC815]|uniref:acyl-CoA dehydrogenase family protein n=1 Tax=Parasphingorhabdus sp. JC815 TaxID=3232140 RepID=UPI003459A59C
MDFSFTEEQQMLRDTITRFLGKAYTFDTRQKLVSSEQPWSPDVWNILVEMGLTELPFSEKAGGLGGSIVDIVSVAEPFGEYLLIEPYLSSILLAGKALELGENDISRSWLQKIISGKAIGAFAHEEGKGTATTALVEFTAKDTDDGYMLNGEKRLVLGGGEADILVVSVRKSGRAGDTGGIALMLVDPKAEGIEINAFQTIDGRSAAHIKIDNVMVPATHLLSEDAYEALSAIIENASIALCAEAVGIMRALLNITNEYTATRKQFGVPIASFQAIAHRLSDMKIAFTKAQATLYYTTALAEAGRTTSRDIAIMKGQIGKLGRAIGEGAIQSHGGVGMTDELIVSHHHKRLIAIDAMFGDSEYHLRKVGLN